MKGCSVCNEPQQETRSGLVCANGHGGAPSVEIEPAHSKLGPSAAGRWTACPGSVRLIESLMVTSGKTKYSIFGDICHEVGKQALEFLFHDKPQPIYPAEDIEETGHTVDQAEEVVEAYVQHVCQGSEQFPACKHKKHWLVWIETRFTVRLIHPDVWGTGDCIVYCPICKELRGIDLKSGSGKEVEAHNNPQLSIYMLLAMYEYMEKMGPVERLRVEISQPRAPSGRTHKVWQPSVRELMGLLTWFQERARATEVPGAPLVAGDHCQESFCPALGACPIWKDRMLALAKERFRKPTNVEVDAEYLAQVLSYTPALKELIEQAHSLAYEAASRGIQIPGFKLVKKRDGNRRYVDENEAAKTLAAWARHNGEDQTLIWKPRKLQTPAQIEKQYGSGVGEVLESVVTRESGGTTLAPESDKRPAITGASVADAKQIFGGERKKLPVL